MSVRLFARAREWIRTPLVLACAAPCAAVSAGAQVITRVVLDNDAFNFWQPPAQRADREYSQGTRLDLLHAGDSRLARRLLGGGAQCRPEPMPAPRVRAATRDCRLVSVALQQAIYTPTLSAVRRRPGERPFAGWFGVEAGMLRESTRSMRAFAVALGVTGRPSLAESSQKAVHEFFGFQAPQGWELQLPTEVTMMASYRGAHDLLHLGHPHAGGLQLVAAPVWAVRAGTLVTDASGGVQVALGIRPPLPWRETGRDLAGGWGMYVAAGATQSIVARNLFLDGSTFGPSERVPRHVTVGTTELAIGVRGPRAVMEWRVHSRGREYAGQPMAHAYSTLALTVH
ncbi:MAG: lipid A deacylase LpxR family protein [Gemmatimonadaceae bacterium]|nr:lipid A deacylase LpxR family protein [Gemmatimonadaceae bacterium]